MNESVPTDLAGLSISSLNFSGNCQNVALGYNVWYNDFFSQEPAVGNWSTTPDPSDAGPGGIGDVWANGTSPEFIHFWRVLLPPSQSIKDFSDAGIAIWTNSTPFYEFFTGDLGEAWPSPNSLDQIASSLASGGGCKNNDSQDAGDIKVYSQFQKGKRRWIQI